MLLQQFPLPCRSMRSVTLEIEDRMVIDVECLDQHACGRDGRVNGQGTRTIDQGFDETT
jgi:hypothetical protein